jgi:hypothetical protein
MKDQKRTNMERSPGADPQVTMLLRAAYAPPADDEFWAGLQQRIVSRLQDAPSVSWSAAVCEWRTATLVAATIALLVTGATIMREQALDATARRLAAGAAYFNTDGVPEGEPVTITVRGRDSIPEDLPERYLNPFEP